MKIAVAGTGYVGLSIATLLAQHNPVVAVDIIPEKVEKINKLCLEHVWSFYDKIEKGIHLYIRN